MNRNNHIFFLSACLFLFACGSILLYSSKVRTAVVLLNHNREKKNRLADPEAIDQTILGNYSEADSPVFSYISLPISHKLRLHDIFPYNFSNSSRLKNYSEISVSKQDLGDANNLEKTPGPSSDEAEAKNITKSCKISFSFRMMDLYCRTAKTMELMSNSSLASGCPYLYPYLEILVNRNLQATLLANVEYIPEEYSFGKISIPANITAKNIKIKIGYYFKSSFDILANLDVQRDLNHEIHTVNTVLLDWKPAFPWPPSKHNPGWDADGVLSCEPAHPAATEPSVPDKSAAQCSFSQFTPGFWDTRKRAFLPSACEFCPLPLLARTGESAWVHFLGDSNMRNLHASACRRIRGVFLKGLGEVCLSRDGRQALVYTVSWMTEKGTGLFGASSALLGLPLAPVLCRARPSPGCEVEWNRTAALTLALVGSHYPKQLIPPARTDVRAWLTSIAARLPPGSGSLAVVLVGGVCVRHFHRFPQYWGQLFQRNNYRLRAVNNATLEAARALGVPALDAFSLTLAAGCEAESNDVVHFRPSVYKAQFDALFSLP
jgi:hypothetical protein